MEAEFDDPDLKKLWADPKHNAGYAQPLVKSYRKKVQAIIAAKDERDLYQMKSLHFEKLKGDRAGQHSMRLNDQWRLIVELRGEGRNKRVGVVEIVDYH
jgi:toxin HigB-1